MHKPFCRRTTTVANIVLAASRTGPTAHIAIETKKRRVLPDLPEAMFMQIASLEFRCLEKGARIHFTFGTDAAGSGRCPTHIESGQFVAEGIEVEKRIGGQYVWMDREPVCEFAILLTGWMQFTPYVLASS